MLQMGAKCQTENWFLLIFINNIINKKNTVIKVLVSNCAAGDLRTNGLGLTFDWFFDCCICKGFQRIQDIIKEERMKSTCS